MGGSEGVWGGGRRVSVNKISVRFFCPLRNGGCAKGVQKAPCGETVVKTDKKDSNMLSINSMVFKYFNSPNSARRKKGNFFFPVGRPRPEPSPKTQPLQVAFSLLERVDLRSQKGRISGKNIGWGRVGWTGQKRKKDAQNKVGAEQTLKVQRREQTLQKHPFRQLNFPARRLLYAFGAF